VLSAAAVLDVTGPASAGTNGQHVAACVGNATQIAKARIWGTNQNGDFAETDSRDINYQFSSCASFGDYWFKKDITLRRVFGDGQYGWPPQCQNPPTSAESPR
jgi:hypothetical protein